MIMKQLLFFIFLLSVHYSWAQDLSKIVYPDTFENSKSSIAKNNISTERIYEFTSLQKGSDSTLAQLITYDSEGNITASESWSNGILLRKENFTYSAYKKIQRIIKEYFTLNEYWVSEFEYDSVGNEIREFIYDRDTTTLLTYARVYNDKNEITASYSALNNDSFKLEKEYSYEDDILIKIEIYGITEKIIGIYSYNVGADRNYKKATYVDLINKDENIEYIFDNENRCVRTNALVVRPTVYLNRAVKVEMNGHVDGNISKTDIRKTQKIKAQRVESLEYNPDGTLASIAERVDAGITKVRKYYYTTQ